MIPLRLNQVAGVIVPVAYHTVTDQPCWSSVANGTTVQNPTGYQASVDYVAKQMRSYGFKVQVKDFTYRCRTTSARP